MGRAPEVVYEATDVKNRDRPSWRALLPRPSIVMNIFTVTSVRPSDPLKGNRLDTRTFGWFPTIQQCHQVIKTNHCNMHEGYYSYIVVEEFAPGIHPIGKQKEWYEWDEDKGWVKMVGSPSCFIGTINFGIG